MLPQAVNLVRLIAEVQVEPSVPGELPTAGRAWIVLAVFGLAMGLLIALLVLTIGRRSYRRYARGPRQGAAPSHKQASPWSEAGRRAAPGEPDPEPDDPDADSEPDPEPLS